MRAFGLIKYLVSGCLFAGIVLGCLSCTGSVDPLETVSLSAIAQSTTVVVPTLTRTPRPTRTTTPTRTPRPTPFPTLSLEAKREIIERNLSIADCELPCWGGITPGKSLWQDVLALWQGLIVEVNRKPDFTHAVLSLDEWCPTCESDRVEIWSKDETVTRIYIGNMFYNEMGMYAGTLSVYLAGFQLPYVLEQYGTPSHIYAEGHVGTYYDALWIEYADLGLLVRYAGDAVYDDVAPLFCFIADGAPSIAVNFQSPGTDFQMVRDHADAMNEYVVSDWAWTVLENPSPEAFYAVFRKLEAPKCIRIPNPTWEYSLLLLPETFDPIFRVEEDAALPELLMTNGGCELPCWWGITPGITRIEEVQAFYTGYGKPMTIGPFHDDFSIYRIGLFARHDPAPLDYVVSQSFVVSDSVVSSIHIGATAPKSISYGDGPSPGVRYYEGEPVLTKSRHLLEDWQRYSLASTLGRFGVPSQVLLAYDHPMCGNVYHLGVIYDDLGILVEYSGEGQHKDDRMLLCPEMEKPTRFHLVLAAPDSGLEFKEHMRYDTVSLETVADMSPDEFYCAYISATSSTCISVPERTKFTCP